MKLKIKILSILTFFINSTLLFPQSSDVVTLDFRNQKIVDIIYGIAEIYDQQVYIDDTVSGNATFHFSDSSFENAIRRFSDHCHLYSYKKDDTWFISKVFFEKSVKENSIALYNITAENVLIESLLTLISRKANVSILFDSLPNTSITVRLEDSSIEDILNLILVKLPGFSIERIGNGFFLGKNNSSSSSRRTTDVYSISLFENKYSISVERASVINFIDTLFKKAHKEYAILGKPNSVLEGLYFSNKEFASILQIILEQSNCDYTIVDDIYYIFEVQRRDILKNIKETKIIQLNNISAENIVSLLPSEYNGSAFIKINKASNSIYLTGSAMEISPIENFIKQIDVVKDGFHYERFDVNYGNIKDIITLIPNKLYENSITVIPETSSFVALVNDETKKEINELLKLFSNKTNVYPVKLKFIKSETLISNLPPSVTKDNITLTQDSSVIFFNGSKILYDSFIKELEFIDVPRHQIKYQLLVIQRQKTNSLNLGSNFTVNTTDATSSGTQILKFGNIFNVNFDLVSKFGLQFAAQLNAELSEGSSHVLADTTLNSISGETVKFSNTNTYRYRDIVNSGDIYTTATREISSGLILSINGWVSGQNMITVSVEAEVSKQGSSNGTGVTADPPSTTQKKVTTNIRTLSGEPVIIGGLFQSETDITEKKTPVLGYIPFLGWLFKSSTVSVAETEFIIYLVPFVEPNNELNQSEIDNIKYFYNKYLAADESHD